MNVSEAPADAPNVLLLLGDGHGDRFLRCRDGVRGEPVETPTLDRLAAEGANFVDAYTPAPVATPGRVGILTGQKPQDVGIWDGRSVLDEGVKTIADVFREAGYRTCLIGTLGLDGSRQFLGFEARPYGDLTGTGGHQEDPLTQITSRWSPNNAKSSPTGGRYGHRYDPVSLDRRSPDPWRGLAGDAGETTIPESNHQERAVVRESIGWLREETRRSDRPWLLVASFSRPSPPLTAPTRHLDRYRSNGEDAVTDPVVDRAENGVEHPLMEAKAERDRTAQFENEETIELDDDAVRQARAAYFASVSYLDEVIGDLLGTLERDGVLEDTIVAYTSDRGNLAGEHGLWWSKTFHDDAVRVPLLIQTPEHRRDDLQPTDIRDPVSLLDVAPTLCGLVGVECGATGDGYDLSATVRSGEDPARDHVTIDYPLPEWGAGTEFRAVRGDDWKVVHFREAPDLAFDLSIDPHENEPLDVDMADGRIGEVATRVDFPEMEERRERDRELSADRRLCIDRGTSGNAYLLSDGRVIDADATLYKPNAMAVDASEIFADHPDNR